MFIQKISPIHCSILIRVFELDDFIVKRTKGDRVICQSQV